MNYDEYYINKGKQLGYPECCVADFLIRVRFPVEILLKEPKRKLDGTGYVPCLDCNEKTEEELIEVISKNRIEEVPFPDY